MTMIRFFTAATLLCSIAATAQAEIAANAADVRPILVGTELPAAAVQTLDGEATDLRKVLDGKPAVLVFYRGGWCPFCVLQLSSLRHLEAGLAKQGVQIVAVSPDAPAALKATLEAEPLGYTLISDADANAIQALRIAFKVDDKTLEAYKGYGIDLEQASGGRVHHALPVPSVFVVDANGVVQFSYVNPDYRTRVPHSLVQAAVDAVLAGEMGKSIRDK